MPSKTKIVVNKGHKGWRAVALTAIVWFLETNYRTAGAAHVLMYAGLLPVVVLYATVFTTHVRGPHGQGIEKATWKKRLAHWWKPVTVFLGGALLVFLFDFLGLFCIAYGIAIFFYEFEYLKVVPVSADHYKRWRNAFWVFLALIILF
ncbi:MAG: hypothetical protein WC505_07480 [Patescibacteria group bacterium]